MPTLEYCNHPGCWTHRGHRGPHSGQVQYEPLVCLCSMPDPTPSDMCARCLRVIANLIHRRRQTR